MFDLGFDVGLCCFDQILQPSIWRIRHAAEFDWPHRYFQFLSSICHLGMFGDFLAASVALPHLLIAIQEPISRGEV